MTFEMEFLVQIYYNFFWQKNTVYIWVTLYNIEGWRDMICHDSKFWVIVIGWYDIIRRGVLYKYTIYFFCFSAQTMHQRKLGRYTFVVFFGLNIMYVYVTHISCKKRTVAYLKVLLVAHYFPILIWVQGLLKRKNK